MKSANLNKTRSNTPAVSPARMILIYIVLNTFGCLANEFDRVAPAETSSIIFSMVLFKRGLMVLDSMDSRASRSGTPALSMTDNCLEKL